AVQRSQSERAKHAAANVQQAATAWKSMSEHLLDHTRLDANWEMLDHYASKVDEQIDLLINYTAGDGFIYRQSARAAVARDIDLNIAGTALALLLLSMVAWALTGRIVRPVAAASNVAEYIAGGKLDVEIPEGSADEIGDLLSSMKVMRDNIKAMMDREVAQRRTAQTRLADALESSQEGVVVVDADDHIALANAQAASFLGVKPDLLKAGSPLSKLWPALEHSVDANRILRRQSDGDPDEICLADGRWLRVSQSATRDRGFIVVCSDITQSKEQKANLRETNARLDAALDNMSQGLCLFDAKNRLEVINRRFFEIFGLARDQIEPGMEFREILVLSKPRNHD
ncbi:MAG: PAS-domain containing protein, partial [Bradyrhizobium sp.]